MKRELLCCLLTDLSLGKLSRKYVEKYIADEFSDINERESGK